MSSRPRRSSRDAATAKPPRICKHPSSEPVDATSCTLRLLRQAVDNLNQNRCLLCDLDFVNLDDNLIIQLFYKADRRDHRSVDSDGNIILPPPTHRCTSQQLKQWFEKGTLQKNNAIEEFSKYDYTVDTDGTNETESDYCEKSLCDSNPAARQEPPSDPQPQEQQQEEQPPSNMPESPQIRFCMGINIKHLQRMDLTEERLEEKIFGFVDTYCKSLSTRLRLENPRNLAGGWNYALPMVGALTAGNDKNRVVWTCQEIRTIWRSFSD